MFYTLIGGFEHVHPSVMSLPEAKEAALHHIRAINFFSGHGLQADINNEILSMINDRIKYIRKKNVSTS